ncbi:unnamed protein product [Coccothraustes coccothraustes]
MNELGLHQLFRKHDWAASFHLPPCPSPDETLSLIRRHQEQAGQPALTLKAGSSSPFPSPTSHLWTGATADPGSTSAQRHREPQERPNPRAGPLASHCGSRAGPTVTGRLRSPLAQPRCPPTAEQPPGRSRAALLARHTRERGAAPHRR